MGAPPPLPPRAPRPPPPLPPARAPMPSDDGIMSTQAKNSLADIALALREEQVQARVVHYKADLQTSPELDAITAQVVAELQQLQQAVASATGTGRQEQVEDRAQIEIDLIRNLKVGLARLFHPGKVSNLVERKLGELSKRFARLFFESELHEKMAGGPQEAKQIRFAEQALYHALARVEPDLRRSIDEFDYVSPDVHALAGARLDALVKELKHDFLGRTTPELNALLKMLNEVLVSFFKSELPPVTGELAWEVVREARLGASETQGGYKVSVKAFPAFRQAFERRFLLKLVAYAEDELLRRAAAREDPFRIETLHFLAQPQIFTDVCELVCDAVYDALYNDGFLDLPGDWRARLASARS